MVNIVREFLLGYYIVIKERIVLIIYIEIIIVIMWLWVISFWYLRCKWMVKNLFKFMRKILKNEVKVNKFIIMKNNL